MKIIENKIECKHCSSVIVSTGRNDLVLCKCGLCGVDGGLDYIRRIGNREDFIELSRFLPELSNSPVDPLVRVNKESDRLIDLLK